MFLPSQDSSVWLELMSRAQLMSPECSKHQVLRFAKKDCGVVNEQKTFCSYQCSPECSMNKFRAYIFTDTCVLYVTRVTPNKNDSINSILQYGRVSDKNCCVVFPTSGFSYMILCPRHCKWKVATTYLAIRTKNN